MQYKIAWIETHLYRTQHADSRKMWCDLVSVKQDRDKGHLGTNQSHAVILVRDLWERCDMWRVTRIGTFSRETGPKSSDLLSSLKMTKCFILCKIRDETRRGEERRREEKRKALSARNPGGYSGMILTGRCDWGQIERAPLSDPLKRSYHVSD